MRDDFALAAARVLFALPDLHRIRPWWHSLRCLRNRSLRALGAAVSPDAIVHQGFFADRRLRLTIAAGAEIRDRVRLGVDEAGLQSSSFSLGPGSLVLSDTHVDCSASVAIGRRSHVGRRNQIFTHSHDVRRRDVPVLDAPITTAPVSIGDDVMLFSDVVILPGVTIGDGAVVAVRAVVTADVPPYTTVAGVPARPIGERT